MGKRTAFVVGRTDRRSTTILLLCLAGGPLAGPWTLRALVSAN